METSLAQQNKVLLKLIVDDIFIIKNELKIIKDLIHTYNKDVIVVEKSKNDMKSSNNSWFF
tara:strand:- start:769 stop:951 length:183 start_codon:yes stop_codon:yes gene_type:complete